VLLDHGEKGVVRGAVALFKNVLKISCRLMRVDDQDEMKGRAWDERQVHIP
jgi:hypothetical protein